MPCSGMKAGRLYPKKNRAGRAPQSLQDLPKIVRKALANDHYYDVDIKNAHPTILNNFCKGTIQCPSLTAYVNDRDRTWTSPQGLGTSTSTMAPLSTVPRFARMGLLYGCLCQYEDVTVSLSISKCNLLAKKRKSNNAHGCAVAFLAKTWSVRSRASDRFKGVASPSTPSYTMASWLKK